jgi:excisionase family DNA binding protein
MIFN